MIGFILFDGKSSRDFFADVSAYTTYNAPARDMEQVTVNGRNGDLLIDHGRYGNIDMKYSVMIRDDFKKNYGNFRDYLMSKVGYKRLEDSMHNSIYRMARLSDNLEPDVGRGSKVGTFDITFNCKPQCWLKSGDIPIIFTSDGMLHNPTCFEAKPLIRAYGRGSFQIGSKTITITKADEYTDLDCDIQDAYKDDSSVNCNGNVQITGYDFPTLPEGNTGIKLGYGITKVEIIPRWWTL